MKKVRRRFSFANVTSMLALFVALGGTTAWAVATIGTNDIKRNAVRSKHIKSGNVKRSDIAANAVNSQRLANGSVASADLADGAVGPGDLGVTPTWTNLQLVTGWSNFDATSTFGPAQCYKDPFGIVHLRGAVERSNGSNLIATLPPACRVFPAGSSADLYASFAAVRLDAGGGNLGAAEMWVGEGVDKLGFDTVPLPAAGEGFALDGAAIAAR